MESYEKIKTGLEKLEQEGVIIRRGKKISSEILKSGISKKENVDAARFFSENITKGDKLNVCPLCGSSEFSHLTFVYGFEYSECKKCEVVFVANPPSEPDLSEAYKSSYYTENNKKLLANDSIIDYRVDNIFRPKIDFISDYLTTRSKTWVDIGCGVGEALHVAHGLGFDVLGIEANPMEAAYARSRFGLNITENYLTDSNLGEFKAKSGVISLFSVLEHILEPNKMLTNISKIQGPGDNLIVEVPHYPSVSCFSQLTFPSHVNRMLHPPLHLFMFPLSTLENILASYGYKIKAVWLFGLDFYEFFSTLGLFVNGLDSSLLSDALSPLVNDFQSVIDNHALSDEMLVVSEKI